MIGHHWIDSAFRVNVIQSSRRIQKVCLTDFEQVIPGLEISQQHCWVKLEPSTIMRFTLFESLQGVLHCTFYGDGAGTGYVVARYSYILQKQVTLHIFLCIMDREWLIRIRTSEGPWKTWDLASPARVWWKVKYLELSWFWGGEGYCCWEKKKRNWSDLTSQWTWMNALDENWRGKIK